MTPSEVGFARMYCKKSTNRWYEKPDAEMITTTARLVVDNNPDDLSAFESKASCLGRNQTSLTTRPQYRLINGVGNNLQEPYLGSTGAPFRRVCPKNYYDNVRTTRNSVNGDYLPNARTIVQKILTKAQKSELMTTEANSLANLALFFVVKDLALHTPVSTSDQCAEIRCCSKGNKAILSKCLRHSACLPISIDENDPFYKNTDVRCLNFVRSQLSSLPSAIQYGEIENTATAFLDLSSLYGTEFEEFTKPIKTFKNGKLRMNAKNLLPVDWRGKYTKASEQFLSVPTTAIIPSLFARNHNKLATELSKLNPTWGDNKLFEEARRINIAVFQNIVYNGGFQEVITGTQSIAPFDEGVDPSANIELQTAYRFSQCFVSSNVSVVDDCNVVTNIALSDTFEKLDVAENKFDDLLRGLLSQKLNIGGISEELINKVAKNKDGVGIDIMSINIMIGRDHGLGTYLETRHAVGLNADFSSWQDLLEVFPQSYIDLLSSVYDSIYDIDLIVGGFLESFNGDGTYLFGETFRKIFEDQLYRSSAGDAYFYTNPSSPYPFTAGQLEAIKVFKFNNLICANSKVGSVAPSPFLVDSASNMNIPCSNFKPLDLTAWKEV